VKINTPLLVMHKDDLARLHLGTKFQDVEVTIKQDDSSPSVGRVFSDGQLSRSFHAVQH